MKLPQGSDWNDPQIIRAFAGRKVDHRLVQLLASHGKPEKLHVLDLGCASGRNTMVLAEVGARVCALDLSAGMVQECKKRLWEAGYTSAAEAVVQGPMNDLTHLESGSLDGVLAFGILQQAQSREEYLQTLKECARILRPKGWLLSANFGPSSQPAGIPLEAHPETPDLYRGFYQGWHFLLEPDALDLLFREAGLGISRDTELKVVQTEKGFRHTINGWYLKA